MLPNAPSECHGKLCLAAWRLAVGWQIRDRTPDTNYDAKPACRTTNRAFPVSANGLWGRDGQQNETSIPK